MYYCIVIVYSEHHCIMQKKPQKTDLWKTSVSAAKVSADFNPAASKTKPRHRRTEAGGGRGGKVLFQTLFFSHRGISEARQEKKILLLIC